MKHLGGHLNKTHVDLGSLTYLKDSFNISSMVDVGCGPGGVVQLAKRLGISALGIDGDKSLKKEWESKLLPVLLHDFTTGAPKIGRYDLAWSVEFLEHVEEKYMDNYFEVFSQCNYVVCTAAPPGTPGHHHVNCQDSLYWTEKFDQYGFKIDWITTDLIRSRSTMRKPFMQNTGMFYRNRKWG